MGLVIHLGLTKNSFNFSDLGLTRKSSFVLWYVVPSLWSMINLELIGLFMDLV